MKSIHDTSNILTVTNHDPLSFVDKHWHRSYVDGSIGKMQHYRSVSNSDEKYKSLHFITLNIVLL